MRELFFVSCAPRDKERTALFHSLTALNAGPFRFFEHNTRGLGECYNQALDDSASTDRILVLAHSDVTIADVFLADKLRLAVEMFDVVGLVGSAAFDADVGDAYPWSAWPRSALSGAVEHAYGALDLWSVFGATPRRCIILDGLLLAVDMLTLGSVRFDPQFRFHLYDLDFCLAAHHAGLVCGTTNVYAQHLSRGDYKSPDYQAAAAAFRNKWKGVQLSC